MPGPVHQKPSSGKDCARVMCTSSVFPIPWSPEAVDIHSFMQAGVYSKRCQPHVPFDPAKSFLSLYPTEMHTYSAKDKEKNGNIWKQSECP